MVASSAMHAMLHSVLRRCLPHHNSFSRASRLAWRRRRSRDTLHHHLFLRDSKRSVDRVDMECRLHHCSTAVGTEDHSRMQRTIIRAHRHSHLTVFQLVNSNTEEGMLKISPSIRRMARHLSNMQVSRCTVHVRNPLLLSSSSISSRRMLNMGGIKAGTSLPTEAHDTVQEGKNSVG